MASDSSRQSPTTPYRQIRANYDEHSITVYQAYSSEIATAAVANQKLHASPKFKPTRMTWIKPSWAWMLYRAGYSYKDPGQERILAIKMRHADFIGLLEKAVLTNEHAKRPENNDAAEATDGEGVGRIEGTEGSTTSSIREAVRNHVAGKPVAVKVQWDPERNVRLGKLDYRSIQIGIPAALSSEWTGKWIEAIEDVTEKARELKRVLDERPDVTDSELIELGLVPAERPFEIPEHLQRSLGMIIE